MSSSTQTSNPSNSTSQDGAPHKRRLSMKILGDKQKKLKLLHRTELVLLTVVVALIWVLPVILLVYYNLPDSTDKQCPHEEVNLYTGKCMDALATVQACLPNATESSDVYIPGGVDVEVLELRFDSFRKGLDTIGASSECINAVTPFYCWYLFGLCDASDTLYQPPYSDCINISTVVCATEWAILTTWYSSIITLPQCDSFQDTDSICNNISTNPATAEVSSNPKQSIDAPTSVTVVETGNCSNSGNCSATVCSPGFYCSWQGICLPRCDEWETLSHSKATVLDVIVWLSASIATVSGIFALVMSFIYRKRMFVFPSVIMVYLIITVLCYAILILIANTDSEKLFCSSCDLRQSQSKSTPFCTISGIADLYILLQVPIWWFFHVLMVFWKIRFPIYANRFTHLMKYIHITVVALAVLLPIIPIVIEFGVYGIEAFGLRYFPPEYCTFNNLAVTLYTVTVPTVIIGQVGLTLLTIIFWVIHKQYGLFRIKRLQSPYSIGSPERRLMVVFSYVVIVLIVFMFGRNITNFNYFDEISQRDYFACEAFRSDLDPPCPKTYQDSYRPEPYALFLLLIGLLPAVSLIFVVDFKDIKKVLMKCLTRCKGSVSTSTANSASAD